MSKPPEEDDGCESPSVYSRSDGDLLDIPTRPDTPEPGTPIDGHFLPQFLCTREFMEDNSEEASSSFGCVDPVETYPMTGRTDHDAVEVNSLYASFEEDDGLPPLDGWCKAYLHTTTCG
jgi:hypothetical protein